MPLTRVPAPRALRIAVACVVAGILTAAPAVAGGEVVVEVRSAAYAPSELSVARGTTVRWSNDVSPSRVHDVVSSIEGLFDSGRFGQGESWAYTFDAAGTFSYICSIHDEMIGAVHVPLSGRVVTTSTGPLMRIRLATRPLAADSPLRYVVRRRVAGTSSWTAWQTTTAAVVEFRPRRPGTYEFVMRVRNTEAGATSRAGDSPVLQLSWGG
jgi:plastocyanin